MIESKDIKKMVQHILRRDKGIADTHLMHPAREWFTGMAITLTLVALGSWFCFYLYSFHTDEMNKEVVIIEQAVPYNAAAVKNALEVFALKQKKYNEIVGGVGTTIPTSTIFGTTTPVEVIATTTKEIPELIIDPPPVFEDEEVGEIFLAP